MKRWRTTVDIIDSGDTDAEGPGRVMRWRAALLEEEMPMSRPHSSLLLIALLALPLPGTAQSNPPRPPVGKEIERLIQQLGSDRFHEREAASRNLTSIGTPALTALR